MKTLDMQYLQSSLTKWRERNHWADTIPFDKFPARYRAEIERDAEQTSGGTSPETYPAVDVYEYVGKRQWHFWGTMDFEMAMKIHDPFLGRGK